MAKPLIQPEEIYEAALQLVQQTESVPLTMRRLSQYLGCSSRTLYQQVGRQEDLIRGVLDHYLRRQAAPITPNAHWRETAYQWAVTLRALLVAVPHLTKQLSTANRGAIVEFTYPLFEAMLAAGLTPKTAIPACRSIVHVTTSLAIAEIETMSGPNPAQSHDDPVSGYAALHEAANFYGLVPNASEVPETFEQTLRWLIAGIPSA
jgi:AcrR family transcriptional regulator